MKKPEFEPGKSEIRTWTSNCQHWIFLNLSSVDWHIVNIYLFIYLFVQGPNCGI